MDYSDTDSESSYDSSSSQDLPPKLHIIKTIEIPNMFKIIYNGNDELNIFCQQIWFMRISFAVGINITYYCSNVFRQNSDANR